MLQFLKNSYLYLQIYIKYTKRIKIKKNDEMAGITQEKLNLTYVSVYVFCNTSIVIHK